MIEQRSAALAEDRVLAPLRERLLDVPWDVPRSIWFGRLAALGLFTVWGTAMLLSKITDPPVLLHLTVILFHEAGHARSSRCSATPCASPAARSASCSCRSPAPSRCIAAATIRRRDLLAHGWG